MSETINLIKANRENRVEIFNAAYNGSYYTIIGCAGNLDEWTAGYRELLGSRGIGKPEKFITFKGKDMNEVYELIGDNAYNDKLTFLMFPLDGLDASKLAIFRLQAQDKWFDDIVDNNQRREEMKNK